MAFHRVSWHSIFVDRLDHDCRSIVADPLGSSSNDAIGGSNRSLGVLVDGSAKPSSFSGNSTTWAIGCPWSIPLGEASHVHEPFVDNNGMDDRTTAAMADDLVGRTGDDAIGQASV